MLDKMNRYEELRQKLDNTQNEDRDTEHEMSNICSELEDNEEGNPVITYWLDTTTCMDAEKVLAHFNPKFIEQLKLSMG
jgi:DNA-binding transcriptional regulator GbsR (MarR family)